MKINQFFQQTLGVELKNPRWSWGGFDSVANRVFLRVWEDQIHADDGVERVQVYWKKRRNNSPGHDERLTHLAMMKKGAQGFGIVARAVDTNPSGARKIASFQDSPLLELGEFSEDESGIYARIRARIPISELVSLTKEGQVILQLLVNHIRADHFVAGDEKTFIGYGEAHRELGLQRHGPHWGNSLRTQGLANLAEWLHKKNLPAITGLIVDQANHRPGDGYYEVNGRPPDDRTWWMEQIKLGIAFDWSQLVRDDELPTAEEFKAFTRAIEEGKVNTVSVETRSRCGSLIKHARQFYRSPDGKLRCAVCGWHRPDDGRVSGDIVEIHHTQPLANLPSGGVRIDSPKAIESLAPLCPCCHRIAHSRAGGGFFAIEELKTIMPKRAVAGSA